MALCQLCKHSHHSLSVPSCLVDNHIWSLLLMKNLNPSQELVLFQYSFYFEYFSFWTNMRSGPWIRVATSTTRTMNRMSIPSLRLSRQTQQTSSPCFPDTMFDDKLYRFGKFASILASNRQTAGPKYQCLTTKLLKLLTAAGHLWRIVQSKNGGNNRETVTSLNLPNAQQNNLTWLQARLCWPFFNFESKYHKRPCISRTFFHKIEAKNQGCGLSMDTSVFGVLKNLINIHKTS